MMLVGKQREDFIITLEGLLNDIILPTQSKFHSILTFVEMEVITNCRQWILQGRGHASASLSSRSVKRIQQCQSAIG